MSKLNYVAAAMAAIAIAAALALGVYAGQWWADRSAPHLPVEAPARLDTVYRERSVAPEDTATTTQAGADDDVARASTPREVVRYETVIDTVRDCYARPSGFDVRGLTSSRPLRVETDRLFSGPSVTLTTFDPSGSRFEQRVYEIPEPQWELYPTAAGEWGPRGFAVTAAATLRYRHLEAWGGYRLAEGGRRGVAAGVRLRPLTLDW